MYRAHTPDESGGLFWYVDEENTFSSIAVYSTWHDAESVAKKIAAMLNAELQNTKVAAPMSGVAGKPASLTPTASAPDCLVGEPVVDATTANKPQRETITPLCRGIFSCREYAFNNCTGDNSSLSCYRA